MFTENPSGIINDIASPGAPWGWPPLPGSASWSPRPTERRAALRSCRGRSRRPGANLKNRIVNCPWSSLPNLDSHRRNRCIYHHCPRSTVQNRSPSATRPRSKRWFCSPDKKQQRWLIIGFPKTFIDGRHTYIIPISNMYLFRQWNVMTWQISGLNQITVNLSLNLRTQK